MRCGVRRRRLDQQAAARLLIVSPCVPGQHFMSARGATERPQRAYEVLKIAVTCGNVRACIGSLSEYAQFARRRARHRPGRSATRATGWIAGGTLQGHISDTPAAARCARVSRRPRVKTRPSALLPAGPTDANWGRQVGPLAAELARVGETHGNPGTGGAARRPREVCCSTRAATARGHAAPERGGQPREQPVPPGRAGNDPLAFAARPGPRPLLAYRQARRHCGAFSASLSAGGADESGRGFRGSVRSSFRGSFRGSVYDQHPLAALSLQVGALSRLLFACPTRLQDDSW